MATVDSTVRCFGGLSVRFKHTAATLGGCDMKFTVVLPPGAKGRTLPVLWWLSGLTCTDRNFVEKAGVQRLLADEAAKDPAKVLPAIVCPDTSPRVEDEAAFKGENDSWDFGSGAGFYVDATAEPWRQRYSMFSYVTKELPDVLAGLELADGVRLDPSKASVFGHSMGGHGALVVALKRPGAYRSVSAFAPIAHPMSCPWGLKAFGGYFGDADKDVWKEWDATMLVAGGATLPGRVLIDQGDADQFLRDGQLQPEALTAAAADKDGVDVDVRIQPGYDHSYFFIASFLPDHLRLHIDALCE